MLRNPRHFHYNEIVSQKMSLKDYVSSGISVELNNGQTRLLSGVEEVGAPVIGYGECPAEILEIAKENLAVHFAVVGITERFDETLILLKTALNWNSIFYSRANVTRNRPH